MEAVYFDEEVRLPTKADTRLLTLLLGIWSAPIRVKLYIVRGTINREDDYEALSYVWGPSPTGRTIQVNRHTNFPVTDNLFNALRRLRSTFRKRTLWIDQICINQSTSSEALKERANQVLMMGDIYRYASCVNVWLGESNVATNAMLECLFDRRRGDKALDNLKSAWWNWRSKDIEFDGEPWHERLWTMQEFALATKLYICWGAARISDPWASFRLDQQLLLPLMEKENLKSLTKKMESILAITRVWRNKWGDRYFINIFIRLVAHSPTPVNCTDRRDLIYGLLSLIEEHEAAEIGVDYTLTAAQVSAKTMFATMHSRGRLQTLCLKRDLYQTNSQQADVPSWCLDFTGNRSQFPTPDDHDRLRESCVQARIDKSDLQIDDTLRLLTIRGIVFDVVEYAILDGRKQHTTVSPMRYKRPPVVLMRRSTTTSSGDWSLQSLFEADTRDESEFSQDCLLHNKSRLQDNDLGQREDLVRSLTPRYGYLLARDIYLNRSDAPIKFLPAPYNTGRGRGRGRHAFHTDGGLVGFSFHAVQRGDRLIYIERSELMLVLRPFERIGQDVRYVFGGMAWVPWVPYRLPNTWFCHRGMYKSWFTIC